MSTWDFATTVEYPLSLPNMWFIRGPHVVYSPFWRMQMIGVAAEGVKSPGFGLFDSVPDDLLAFGRGASFAPKKVSEILGLKKEDVSRLAAVSTASVRYDDAIPEQVRDRLEEIASTMNMVAQAFDGDVDKTVAWFKASNPMLGDVSPRDMIRLGKYIRLRKFIINAMMERSGSAAV